MNRIGPHRIFVKYVVQGLLCVLALAGCSRNHYDTTLTDADVEAVAKRIPLNGNAWGIAELKSILKSESSHPRANLMLAELLFHENPSVDRVSKHLDRAASPRAPREMRYWATISRCRMLIHEGRVDEAFSVANHFLEKAMREEWPEQGIEDCRALAREVRMAVIQAKMEQEGVDTALSAMEALVAEAPGHASVRINYGTVLRDAGQWDRAVEQFRIVMEQHPDGWLGFAARVGLARTHEARGDLSQARQQAGIARNLGRDFGMSEDALNHYLQSIEGPHP